MSDVTISYKGSPIATMDASGTKTLQTQGKYCEDNITVQYAGGGGSSITVEPLTVTSAGTFTAPSGTAYNPVEVQNPLASDFQIPGWGGASTISGTLANPAGDIVTLQILRTWLRNGTGVALIDFSFNGMNVNDAAVVSWKNNEIEIYSVNASTATGESDLMSFGVRINVTTGDAYGFLFSNGTYTDMSQYLPYIETTMRVYGFQLDDF